MKKFVTLILLLCITAVTALFVCGCSLFGKNPKSEETETVHFSFTLPEGQFPDGSTEYATDAPVGGKVTLPENPRLDDYIFGGWVENGGYYPWDFETYVVRKENGDSPVYLVPRWIPTTEDRLVEFDGKSVSGYNVPIAVVDTDEDSYSFDGNVVCSTGSSWTVKYKGEVLRDKIIHGLEPGDNYCTIIVRSPGGKRENQYNVTVHRSYNVTVSYCHDGDVLLTETTKTGYEYTVKGCDWVDITGYDAVGWRLDGQKVTSFVPMYDTSLFAIVDGKTYTVTFDSDGGYSEVESKRVKYDETFTLPYAHREGYNFLGWYYDEHKCGNGGARYKFGDLEDITLTAVWERRSYNIAVTATTAGGSVTGGGTYYYGEEVTVTAITDPGYTFMGWYISGHSSKISDALSLSPEYKFDADATKVDLVAKWQKCGVTAKANVGGVILPETSAYGAEFTIKTTLSQECGLTFDGWYDVFNQLVSTDTEYTFVLNATYISLTAKWSGFRLDDFELESDDGVNLKIVGLKNKDLIDVVIPEYITQIGDSADDMSDFNNNSNFIRLTIGRNVKAIYNCFESCYKLIEICNLSSELDLTDSDVAEYALNVVNDDSTKLDFGNSGYVFYADDDFTYLVGYTGEDTDLTLPKAYKGKPYEIYNYAFNGSPTLTSVEIAETTTGIGRRAFAACPDLKSVMFNIDEFESSEHLSTVFADSGITYGITVTFGADVKTIPNYLLHGGNIRTIKFADDSKLTVLDDRGVFANNSIKSIYIPRSVTEIKPFALAIPSLNTVYFYATNCSVAKNAFSGAGRGGAGFALYIGNEVTRLPDNMLYADNAPDVLSLNFGENSAIETIGENAVRGADIFSVTIPSTVTEICEHAFAGCTGLGVLNYNVVDCTIAQNAFSDVGTRNLTVNIGKDVERIPTWFNSLEITRVYFEGNGKCTVIEEGAFSGQAITSITLPNSLTTIEEGAFSGSALTSVTLGSVVTIGDRAFSGCPLTGLTLPSSVTTIGQYAFQNCNKITTLTIPASVTTIEQYAFQNCSKITTLTIPASVTAIEQYAFQKCSGITTLTISASVAEIGTGAFGACGELTLYYNAENWSADGYVFTDTTITALYVGSTVRTINGGMFGRGIKKIYFNDESDSLTVSDDAFDCTDLTTLYIGGENLTLGQNAFYNCVSLTSITFNAVNATDTPGDVFAFTANASQLSIDIGKKADSVPAKLFYVSGNPIKVSSINFDVSGVCEHIGEYAFCDMGNMDFSLYIRMPIKSIGSNAFSGTVFSRVYFDAENCADSDDYIFTGCTIEIQSHVVRVPAKLASSGEKTVSKYKSLSFSNPALLESIGSYAFSGYYMGMYNNGLGADRAVKLKTLEPYAFANIRLYTFYSDSVEEVGSYAFYNTNVSDIRLTNVKTLGENAFSGSIGLEKCSIWGSITALPKRCFAGCTSLLEFDIYSNFTEIGEYAFDGCTALEIVYIGPYVTKIGQYAFKDCTNLTKAHFESDKDWKAGISTILNVWLQGGVYAARLLTENHVDKTWTRVD